LVLAKCMAHRLGQPVGASGLLGSCGSDRRCVLAWLPASYRSARNSQEAPEASDSYISVSSVDCQDRGHRTSSRPPIYICQQSLFEPSTRSYLSSCPVILCDTLNPQPRSPLGIALRRPPAPCYRRPKVARLTWGSS
jgi:hypothetical protein